MKIRRLPVVRSDFDGIPLPDNSIQIPFERQFSVEEYEKLKLGHLRRSGADHTLALFESNVLYLYHTSDPPTCTYKIILSQLDHGA